MPYRRNGYDVKRVKHVGLRPVLQTDVDRAGQPYGDRAQGQTIFYYKNLARTFPFDYVPAQGDSLPMIVRRWHLRVVPEGVKANLPLLDGSVAPITYRAPLWWTAPVFIIEGETIWHTARQYIPLPGDDPFPPDMYPDERRSALQSFYLYSLQDLSENSNAIERMQRRIDGIRRQNNSRESKRKRPISSLLSVLMDGATIAPSEKVEELMQAIRIKRLEQPDLLWRLGEVSALMIRAGVDFPSPDTQIERDDGE